ncbi:hypothetical protein AB0F17_62045 [Nonomuraea sp. NPDC026600]|uniref:hypothetical protein n=1 Tax=Nonomuraea sp. NPDC026600 TaxID=3155363 RepID=UPI0033E5B1ED
MTMDDGDPLLTGPAGLGDLDEEPGGGDQDDADREEPRHCPCGNRLRPPARRADGARHGGRRSKYCSAACRSRFRASRRTAQQKEATEATLRAFALGERFLPSLEQTQQLGGDLRELLRAITVIQAQMLKDAEGDAQEALAAAGEQEEIAADAEAGRDRAQEEAHEERGKRAAAVRAQREAETRADQADERAREADERAQQAEARAGEAREQERTARKEAKEEGEARVKADTAAEAARRERDTAVAAREAAEQREIGLRATFDAQAAKLIALDGQLRAAQDEVAKLEKEKDDEAKRATKAERRAEQGEADAREARQETKDVRAELKDAGAKLSTAQREVGEAATALAVAQTKLEEAQVRQRYLERRLTAVDQKAQPASHTDTEPHDRQ